MKKYTILARLRERGSATEGEKVFVIEAESEAVAYLEIPKEYEVIGIEEENIKG